LDGLGQTIQVIKAADSGVTALNGLLDQADAIAQSAQNALAQGTQEARLTGDVDLRDVSDITSLTGVTAGSNIVITVTDPTDPSTPSINANPIVLSNNDSIEQIITSINDLNDTNGLAEDAIEASLTEEGFLEIKSLNGGNLRVEFIEGGASTPAEDEALASALGFGALATQEDDGAGSQIVGATASGSALISSVALYDQTPATPTIADASTRIQDLGDSTGANTFSGVDDAGDTISLTINGTTPSGTIGLAFNSGGGDQTIQGLVDDINASAVSSLVEASYNTTTGQIDIRALDASVDSIEFTVDSVDAGGGNLDLNFGFGTGITDAALAGGQSLEEIINFGSSADELAALEVEYDSILTQIDEIVGNGDTGYQGTNLLNGDSITTYFNEFRSSSITSTGVTFNSAGLGLSAADFANQDNIDLRFDELSEAVAAVRTFGNTLANDLNVIETRQEFTTNLVNTLEEGADKLTLADQNAEGAKLLALQTRQQLGVTSLALASQSQQSILRLF
jgi:flagellin-like hook-associated protein FlgL